VAGINTPWSVDILKGKAVLIIFYGSYFTGNPFYF
jgi:hypothetical protein